MEITGDPPPLWPQLSPMRRRRSSSPLLSPPVLIVLLPIIALVLLFFAVPPFLSITTQIFRPSGVKKSWDSLNILLVLFAILCGVFARRNDDDNSSNNNNVRDDNNKPSTPVSQHWFDQFSERKMYDDNLPINSSATGVRGLKRSSSSYPDLRQESLWENNEDRFRFFDDFEINKYRSSSSINDSNDRVHVFRGRRSESVEASEAKVIPVDTFVLRSSPSSPQSNSPAPSTPPPPPPPPPDARHKPRRTYQAVGQKERVMGQNDRVEFSRCNPQPVTPQPPPPPPPRRPPSPLVQVGNRSEQKYVKLERRKSNATKEIKMVFDSLRKRKKKQKAKDHDYHQHDCPLHSPSEPPAHYSNTIPPPSPATPPPPPPLPPPSVFQKYNLFRKGSKSKKIHSVPAPPPPPPPPALSLSKRSSKQSTQIPPIPPAAPPPAFVSTKRLSRQNSHIPPPSKPPPAPPTPPPESSRRRSTASTGRPPLPTKLNTSSCYDDNVNSGGQSPLIPMPPPPPSPPFKMPEFKFVFRGDFVKIRSSPSSRCSSPDLEEVDVSSTKDDSETVSMADGDDGGGVGVGVGGVPVFCPSPDVNAKAETFIARLRDGWKLEKINSMKEKQRI